MGFGALPQQVFVFVYTNALLAKFVFKKSVIVIKKYFKFFAIQLQQAMPLAIHFARHCLLGYLPNPLFIAEVPSAAARFANAFGSCFEKTMVF